MTHADARELLGLYALGALEGEQRPAMTRHLEECASCRREAIELEEAAATLAHMVPALQPSPQLTQRILAAAKAEAPLAAHPLAEARAPRGDVARRRWRLLPVAAGVGVAAVVTGLVVSNLALRARLDRAAAVIARGRDLLEFIASPDVRTVALTSDHLPWARAFVAYDRHSERLFLVAFDLPPPPPGHVYQLWAIGDDVRPAGVFSTDARGGAVLRDRWSPEPTEASMFAVSLEPSPGATEPTGKIVLMGGRRGAGR
jgi:anti-sigma-K factor RskA